MNKYFILEDVYCEGAKDVRVIDCEGINQAISDLYKGVRLPDDSFQALRLLVTHGRSAALLHNMQNFRICRKDIAQKISVIADNFVQMIPISLQCNLNRVIEDYVIINPLSKARVDIEATDAKWWDGCVGGEIQHWYSLTLKGDSILAPIFRIKEAPTHIVVNENIKSIFDQIDSECVYFQELAVSGGAK